MNRRTFLAVACSAAPGGRAFCRQPAGYPECYENGMEAAQKGAYGAAVRCLEDCLALRPGDPAATRELAAIRAGRERMSLAGRLADEARHRKRWNWFKAWLPPVVAAYGAALVAAIFLGLRQAHRAKGPA